MVLGDGCLGCLYLFLVLHVMSCLLTWTNIGPWWHHNAIAMEWQEGTPVISNQPSADGHCCRAPLASIKLTPTLLVSTI